MDAGLAEIGKAYQASNTNTGWGPSATKLDETQGQGQEQTDPRILETYLKLFSDKDLAKLPVSWSGVENSRGNKSYGANVSFQEIMRQGQTSHKALASDEGIKNLSETLQDYVIGLHENAKLIDQEMACDLLEIFQNPKNVDFFLKNYQVPEQEKSKSFKEEVHEIYSEKLGKAQQVVASATTNAAAKVSEKVKGTISETINAAVFYNGVDKDPRIQRLNNGEAGKTWGKIRERPCGSMSLWASTPSKEKPWRP